LNEGPSRRQQLMVFARNFFAHPRMLGSLIPSSRFLVEQVLEDVDWRRAKTIVEYGPGVGNFTSTILRRMRPDARLLALELNEEFVRFLRETMPDPRLEVLHESAANVERGLAERGLLPADYVISGIPFSTMPKHVRAAILRSTRTVLDPDGAMLVYQFSRRVLPYLEHEFGRVDRGFEPLNVLPARVFRCRP
jgi:phospholipid N-methyltransferase